MGRKVLGQFQLDFSGCWVLQPERIVSSAAGLYHLGTRAIKSRGNSLCSIVFRPESTVTVEPLVNLLVLTSKFVLVLILAALLFLP